MELSSEVELSWVSICEVEALSAVAACCRSDSVLMVAGTAVDAVVEVVEVLEVGAAALLACMTS